MNTVSKTGYRFPQKLHPLSLLAQLTSRRASGCLEVFSGSVSWSIYLEEGKLTYASYSVDPFERLDRHLRRLSHQIPTLISATRVQVRLIFETALENQSNQNSDYQAICWLVSQEYLNFAQAGTLIEELAKEVLESFLSVKEGSHEFVERNQLEELPKFCHLNLRSLVEQCQKQLRHRHSLEATSQQRPESLYHNKTQRQTEFTRASVAKDSVNISANPPSVDTPSQSTGKTTYTIACIDDSPTVLNAINSFLEDKSFSVVMIDDPVKALMQIVRSKPDLILLDVEMPNLDGYELCSLLRRHSSFKNTPIIMVTGKTGFIDRAKAKLVRASGYLTKPFTQSDLLKMMFKYLT